MNKRIVIMLVVIVAVSAVTAGIWWGTQGKNNGGTNHSPNGQEEQKRKTEETEKQPDIKVQVPDNVTPAVDDSEPEYTRVGTTWDKSGFDTTTYNYRSSGEKKPDQIPKPDTKPMPPTPIPPDNGGNVTPTPPDDNEDITPTPPDNGEELPVVKSGTFLVQYVDEDGNEIDTTESVTETIGVERIFQAKDIDGYELISEQEQKGTLQEESEEQTIIFTYKKLRYGTITTRYVDENFRDLEIPSVNEKAVVEKEYTIEPKAFSGYRQIDAQPVKVVLANENDSAEVIFHLEKIVIPGTITVTYLDENGIEIQSKKVLSNQNTDEVHQVKAEVIAGYTLQENYVRAVSFGAGETAKEVQFHYKKDVAGTDVYVIELDRYHIKNDGTDPTESTEGINQAIRDAVAAGFKKVKLPAGNYTIDPDVKVPLLIEDAAHKKWTHNRLGIVLESDMQFDMTGCTLTQQPKKYAYTSVITVSGCKNTKIIGGTIIGDKYTHYYGTRINEDGTALESGDFDPATGLPIADDTKMRTKDYIVDFTNEDGTTKALPDKFYVMPLWNTTMNTVDGGCRYIYCYDENDNYLGITTGGAGYVKQAQLVPGTKKIKISLKGETRSDAVFYITEESIYPTYEFGTCVTVAHSDGVEIVGTTMRSATGDCITTMAPPLAVTVDNFSVIDCDLSDSRRQGISYVATGENYLVKDTKIYGIGGVDPQCGIDFEHYDYCRNTIIDGSEFYNNKKLDIINYNGTDIEVKNSKFTGLVGATFGYGMQVHDNYFEYVEGQDKIHKSAGVQLQTKNNVVWDNHFVNSSLNVTGEASEAYGNLLEQGNATIRNTYRNIYRDMKRVEIIKTETFGVFEGSEFIDCKELVSANFGKFEGPMVVRNCKFTNSTLNGRGVNTIEFCSFDNPDTPIQDGWAGEELVSYYRCNIDCSNTKFLAQGSKRNNSFKECDIKTKRDNVAVYGSTTVEDSTITFETKDSDVSKVIKVNTGIYGEDRSPWNFTNCTFIATDPISVHATNGHETNKTVGPVTLN